MLQARKQPRGLEVSLFPRSHSGSPWLLGCPRLLATPSTSLPSSAQAPAPPPSAPPLSVPGPYRTALSSHTHGVTPSMPRPPSPQTPPASGPRSSHGSGFSSPAHRTSLIMELLWSPGGSSLPLTGVRWRVPGSSVPPARETPDGSDQGVCSARTCFGADCGLPWAVGAFPFFTACNCGHSPREARGLAPVAQPSG